MRQLRVKLLCASFQVNLSYLPAYIQLKDTVSALFRALSCFLGPFWRHSWPKIGQDHYDHGFARHTGATYSVQLVRASACEGSGGIEHDSTDSHSLLCFMGGRAEFVCACLCAAVRRCAELAVVRHRWARRAEVRGRCSQSVSIPSVLCAGACEEDHSSRPRWSIPRERGRGNPLFHRLCRW